jgi:hypothetical protein
MVAAGQVASTFGTLSVCKPFPALGFAVLRLVCCHTPTACTPMAFLHAATTPS